MPRTAPAVIHTVQPSSRLCWATCVKMALEVKRGVVNPDITPQRIAARVLYEDKDVNEGVAAQVTKAALEAYGVGAVFVNASLLWAALKTEIDNNHPILIRVDWKGGGSHRMVIGGYEESGALGAMHWIFLNDPLRNAEKKVFFDGFLAGRYDPVQDAGVDAGNCTWVSTIKTS